MERTEIINFLRENLTIELETEMTNYFEGNCLNITSRLTINDGDERIIISEANEEIIINSD